MNEASTATRTYVGDPVGGMDVARATCAHRVEHGGSPYYVCGARCAETYRKNPGAGLAKASTADAAKPCCSGSKGDCGSTQPAAKASGKYICPMCPGVESDVPAACPKCGMALEPAAPISGRRQVQYTCPMHPEVIRDEPGECPKCGMALEPTTLSVARKSTRLNSS